MKTYTFQRKIPIASSYDAVVAGASDARWLLEGRTRTHRDWMTNALNDWSMVTGGRFKFVSGTETESQLYGVGEDLGKFPNLAPGKPQTIGILAASCRS